MLFDYDMMPFFSGGIKGAYSGAAGSMRRDAEHQGAQHPASVGLIPGEGLNTLPNLIFIVQIKRVKYL